MCVLARVKHERGLSIAALLRTLGVVVSGPGWSTNSIASNALCEQESGRGGETCSDCRGEDRETFEIANSSTGKYGKNELQ